VDYRALNDISIKDFSPIPDIVEMRDRFANAKYFSKFDLRDGYHTHQKFSKGDF
jgi:hypothetical protein